jgi:methionyl-tRNA synthetase
MAQKYCGGQGPNINADEIPTENPLRKLAQDLSLKVSQAYEALSFSEACGGVLNLIRAGNKYLDEQAPWTLYKQGESAKVEEVLYATLESVRLAAYLLSPIIPTLSTKIYHQLGLMVNFNENNSLSSQIPYATHALWGILTSGQPIQEPQPIFQRLELPTEVASEPCL